MFSTGDNSTFSSGKGWDEDDSSSLDEFFEDTKVQTLVPTNANPLIAGTAQPGNKDSSQVPKRTAWNRQQRQAMTLVNTGLEEQQPATPDTTAIRHQASDAFTEVILPSTGDSNPLRNSSSIPTEAGLSMSGFKSLFRKPSKQEEEERLKMEEERRQAEYNT